MIALGAAGPHFGQHTKVADVRFEDVDALHRKITKSGSTYAANRVVAVLSKMFALAIKWRMCESNPVKGIERNKEYHRRRYLSSDELVRLTKALAKHPDKTAADAIRLLLLTGARRNEVCAMRWCDIDLADATLTVSRQLQETGRGLVVLPPRSYFHLTKEVCVVFPVFRHQRMIGVGVVSYANNGNNRFV